MWYKSTLAGVVLISQHGSWSCSRREMKWSGSRLKINPSSCSVHINESRYSYHFLVNLKRVNFALGYVSLLQIVKWLNLKVCIFLKCSINNSADFILLKTMHIWHMLKFKTSVFRSHKIQQCSTEYIWESPLALCNYYEH